jgi:4'-phosphopantetheinyl transferase
VTAPRRRVEWCATAAWTVREIGDALAILSAEERARYDRLQVPADARDFAAAHALLRRTLSDVAGGPPESWRFRTDANGKPFVDAAPPQWSISLAHTRGMVACAVATEPAVGVDVESIHRIVAAEKIAGRFFARSESAALAELGDEVRRQRFFELWTLKEALLKAVGVGLTLPLHEVVFDVAALAGGAVAMTGAPPEVAARQWSFELFAPAPGYCGALAVQAADTR